MNPLLQYIDFCQGAGRTGLLSVGAQAGSCGCPSCFWAVMVGRGPKPTRAALLGFFMAFTLQEDV